MGVRASERSVSSIQFVDDARKIVDISIDRFITFLNRLDKQHYGCRFVALELFRYYRNEPIRLANEAYLNICSANKIFVRDKATLDRRLKLFRIAIDNYNRLSKLIGIVYNKFSFSFTPNSFANIIDLIDKEKIA